MTYCGPECQYRDWKRHKHQCVLWRVREWQRYLLFNGTPLPDCHVRLILSYALAPPISGSGRRILDDPGNALLQQTLAVSRPQSGHSAAAEVVRPFLLIANCEDPRGPFEHGGFWQNNAWQCSQNLRCDIFQRKIFLSNIFPQPFFAQSNA